jgi:hypothetical protein
MRRFTVLALGFVLCNAIAFAQRTPAVGSAPDLISNTVGWTFVPITPCRQVDTRQATGGPGGPVTTAVMTLQVTGAAYPGVLAGANPCTASSGAPTGSVALAVNLTMAGVAGLADLRAAPQGTPPTSSIMNSSGSNIANSISLPVNSVNGQIDVKSGGANFNLIIDVFGYYLNGYLKEPVVIIGSDNAIATEFLVNVGTAQALFSVGENTANGTGAIESHHGSDPAIFISDGPWITGSVYGISQFIGVRGFGGSYGVSGYVDDSAVGSVGTKGEIWHDAFTMVAGGDLGHVTGVGTGIGGYFRTTTTSGLGLAGMNVPVIGDTDQQNSGQFQSSHAAANGIVSRSPDTTFNNSGGAWGGTFFGFSEGVNASCGGTYDAGGNCFAFDASGNDITVSGGIYYTPTPHPTDAGQEISLSSLSGGEAGLYFRGEAQIVNGFATIPVPDHFKLVADSKGVTAVATPIGELAVVAVISMDMDKIVIQGSKDVKVHYMVNGYRKGFEMQPVHENISFIPRGEHATLASNLKPEIRQRLIANGIYNADGTVNMKNAEKMGWTKAWAKARTHPETPALAAGTPVAK